MLWTDEATVPAAKLHQLRLCGLLDEMGREFIECHWLAVNGVFNFEHLGEPLGLRCTAGR